MSETIFSFSISSDICGSQGPDWGTVRGGNTEWIIGTNDYVLARWFINTDWGAHHRVQMHRGCLVFDTSSLSVGDEISAAKIQMDAKYSARGNGVTPVFEVVHFVRTSGVTLPLGDDTEANWDRLGGLGILCGGLLVTPAMVDYEAVEVDLNAAGITSIAKGGITIFGFITDRDATNSPPSDKTSAGCMIEAVNLVITYEAEGALKVVTIAATDVTKNSLTMNGQITQGAATKRGFDWGVDAESLVNEWYEEGSFGVEEFSHPVTGLTPGQEFCHRAKAC